MKRIVRPTGEEAFEEQLKGLYRQDDVFWRDLEEESDRGIALAAGAFFENILGECLANYFAACSASTNLLSSPSGLRNFSSRLDCCRALRIIDDKNYTALNLIGKIRNDFAHNLLAKFSDEGMSDRVSELFRRLYPDPEYRLVDESARKTFAFCCLVVALENHRREIEVLIHTEKYDESIPQYIDRKKKDSQSSDVHD